MTTANPTFVIVYNVMNKSKRNGVSSTIYKTCPHKVKTRTDAMNYFMDVVNGKTPHVHRRLVEIRG